MSALTITLLTKYIPSSSSNGYDNGNCNQQRKKLPARIRIVDGVAFDIRIAIARHGALHHAFERIAGEEGAGAGVGIAGAEIQLAAGVGVFAGEAQVGRQRAKLL